LLGRPFPKEYRGAFIDYHLLDIFKRLERRGQPRLIYLEDVVFEHLHYRTGKGDFDEIYGKRDRFGDDDTFLQLRNERSAAAATLLAAIEGASATLQSVASGTTTPTLLQATLLDRELPLPWRIRLWFWFTARTLVRLLRDRGPAPRHQERLP
jgi:hypothetical protein